MIYYFLMLLLGAIGSITLKTFCIYQNSSTTNNSIYFDQRKCSNKLILGWLLILLFFIMGSRSVLVGTDTQSYAYQYYDANFESIKINSFFDILYGEIGYKIIIAFFRMCHLPWQGFIIIISGFECYSIGRFLYSFSKDYFLSFFIHVTFGIFAMSLTGVRQTLAVSLVLLGFVLLIEGKAFCWFLLTMLACSIHFSAVVSILILLIVKVVRFKNKQRIVIWLIIPPIMRFFGMRLLYFIQNILPIKYKYNGYYDLLNLSINPLVLLEQYFILLFCFLCLIAGKSKLNNRNYQFFALSSIFVAITELSSAVYMAVRLGYYFVFFMIILLTNILNEIDNGYLKIGLKIMFLTLMLMHFIITIPNSSFGITPYIPFYI